MKTVACLREKVQELSRFRKVRYSCPEKGIYDASHREFLKYTLIEYGPRKVLAAVVALAPAARRAQLRKRYASKRPADARTREGRAAYTPVVLRALKDLGRCA